MKKTLLTLSILGISGIRALGADTPMTAWAHLLIGKSGQDQATAITSTSSNEIYWMLTDGTAGTDRDVTYSGEMLYEGAPYDGTGSNKNLTILKTDAGGEKIWCAYSAWGDFGAGEGGLVATPEGDIVFAGTVAHTDGYLDHPVTIVDGTGKATEIEWEAARRSDRMIVGALSADGELKWARTYALDTAPVPGATGTKVEFTSDAINTKGVAVDGDGNIYVCGNFRTAFTFPLSDGSSVTLQPRNVTGWNGDPQLTAGSLFLVKLNREGYFLANLEEEGEKEIAASYIEQLSWNDGKLYAYGYMKGMDGNSVNVGGFSLTPSDYISPIVGCLDEGLKAEWIKCFPGDAVGGKNAVQNVGLTVSEGHIWLAGMYNGKISDPDDESLSVESTQGNLREGFIIKLGDKGEWLASANSRTDFSYNYLTGYSKVILPEWDEASVYVYGYAMNSSTGVFLRCYDKTTLAGEPDKSWSVVTEGGVPTCQNIEYLPETGAAYITVRGNKPFLPIGGVATENPGGYTNLLARLDLPMPLSTGLSPVSLEKDGNLRVKVVDGGVMLKKRSPDVSEVVFYDICGSITAKTELEANSEKFLPLSPGIYIVEGRKIIVGK